MSCHIAKAAGSSFRRMLEKAHGDQCVLLEGPPQLGRETWPLFKHRYWFARSFDSHDLRYVDLTDAWPGLRFSVILRDPIERFLSLYFFLRSIAASTLWVSDEVEAERWLDRNFPSVDAVLKHAANGQTAFLGCAEASRPITAVDLDAAPENLKGYDYIGFTECSDALPGLIAGEFPEFRGAVLPVDNVTPRRNSARLWRERIDPKVAARVRYAHGLDLRLYEAAVTLNISRGHPVPG
jgi:hypothetical protein